MGKEIFERGISIWISETESLNVSDPFRLKNRHRKRLFPHAYTILHKVLFLRKKMQKFEKNVGFFVVDLMRFPCSKNAILRPEMNSKMQKYMAPLTSLSWTDDVFLASNFFCPICILQLVSDRGGSFFEAGNRIKLTLKDPNFSLKFRTLFRKKSTLVERVYSWGERSLSEGIRSGFQKPKA